MQMVLEHIHMSESFYKNKSLQYSKLIQTPMTRLCLEDVWIISIITFSKTKVIILSWKHRHLDEPKTLKKRIIMYWCLHKQEYGDSQTKYLLIFGTGWVFQKWYSFWFCSCIFRMYLSTSGMRRGGTCAFIPNPSVW